MLTLAPPLNRIPAKRPARRLFRRSSHVIRAEKTKDGPKVAVVGVTGAVGQEFLKVPNPHSFLSDTLFRQGTPTTEVSIQRMQVFGQCQATNPSSFDHNYHIFCLRSAGKKMNFDGQEYVVEELKEDSFGDVDIALFSAGGGISKKFAPLAVDSGCIVRFPLFPLLHLRI